MLYSKIQSSVGSEWHTGQQLTRYQEIVPPIIFQTPQAKFGNHYFTSVDNVQEIFQALLATCFEFARGSVTERAL